MVKKKADSQVGFDQLLKETDSRYGKNVFGLANMVKDHATLIPTGIFPLDFALFGGLAENMVHTFVGREHAGKTTAALRTLGNYQRKYPDDFAMYVDAEGTLDLVWAERLGVDTDRLYLVQPDEGEQAIDIVITAAKNLDNVGFVVTDSIPALVASQEAAASAYDQQVGLRAKMYSKFLNQLNCAMFKRKKEYKHLTAIMINQWRNKIGQLYGDPRMMPGGDQQKYQNFSAIDFKYVGEKQGKDSNDMEIVEYNEQGFVLHKFKGPKHLRAGEFLMMCNPEGDMLPGSIDAFKSVFLTAKKYGLKRGHKVYGIDQTFKLDSEIREYFIQNPDKLLDFEAQLIAIRRNDYGYPVLPPDNYLMRSQVEFKIAQKDTPDDDAEDTEEG